MLIIKKKKKKKVFKSAILVYTQKLHIIILKYITIFSRPARCTDELLVMS